MSISTQSAFAAALLDLDKGVPGGLTSWNGPRPDRRFEVYRNNVAVGLTGALASRFPVTRKIVGDAFFAGMAQVFIGVHPPRSPLLLGYGDSLADFVETFEPAAKLSYLPDVVRLEAARGRAYHAADVAPLDASDFAVLDGDRLADLRFGFHPSASIVRSRHPVVTIWAMHAEEAPMQPLETWDGEDALIVRPHMTVHVVRLPVGGACFLSALMRRETLGDAVGAALDAAPDFDLPANLAGILRAGGLIEIH